MLGDLSKRGFVVTAGMLIAPPGVDPETARAGLVFGGRLAEREIAFPAIDPQLDEQRRFHQRHEVIGEVDMIRPCADAINARLEMARG